MFPSDLVFNNIAFVSLPLAVILAIFTATFLFWRSGRHELFDSELLFDTILVSVTGGLILGRIFEFIFNPDRFNWSFAKLIFFNAYGGLDFYGFILGMAIFGSLYLARKRIKIFQILDLAAAPLAAASIIISLGYARFYHAIGYFLIFVILKRLAVKKRHFGYFFCFYLVSVSILDLVLFQARDETTLVLGKVYQAAMPALFLAGAVFCWYFLARRNTVFDIKGLLAVILLVIFGAKRVLTSLDEAGARSRILVLLPYFLVRSILKLLKFTTREISLGMNEFLNVLGIKK